jgi:hypothetical protein
MSQTSSEKAFREFIDAFNREDLAALDEAWTSPFLSNTNVSRIMFATMNENDYPPPTDYLKLLTFDRGLNASGADRKGRGHPASLTTSSTIMSGASQLSM